MVHDIDLLKDIALGIIFAVGAAHVARLFRQPLILGYIVGGILLSNKMGFGLVSDAASIELISEIGLILLLFIIGLEMNLRELGRTGKSILVVGVGQFAINALLGLLFFFQLGYHLGDGSFNLLYLAVVMSLSSTLIVVKLLRDKFELKTVAGRLTLGVLIVQDMWAILFLALQPNLSEPGIVSIVQSIAAGIVLIAVSFALSRYALAVLFQASARHPELILLTSVAWCFIVGGAAEFLGLSREMGALIAGVSISAFPYGADVISKVAGVRDFFVTLFFVALGMQVPIPTAGVLVQSMFIVGFILVSRFIAVVPVTYLTGEGLRAGSIASLNLAQISEFSLVILALGESYGHVTGDLGSVVLTSMIITSLLSTYVIQYNDRIARVLVDVYKRAGIRDRGVLRETDPTERHVTDIVLLGNYRICQALLGVVEERAPHMKGRITVVDYHAALGKKVLARGFHWEYGDLAHPDSLEQLGIHHAQVIVCTISDTFLKGITTRRLLLNLKKLAPGAAVIMTGEETTDSEELISQGAHDVLIPGEITGERIFEILCKDEIPA